MKTRFSVNDDVFIGNGSLENCYKYYEDYYKESGFVLDKKREEVYKEFDKEIQLNEGDRVDLLGFKIVKWKCLDLDNDLILYALEEE